MLPENSLQSLIDTLYQTHFPAHDSAVVKGSVPDPLASISVERLRTTLDEMGQYLYAEELPTLPDPAPTDDICLRILNHWETLQRSEKGLAIHINTLETDIATMQPWGDFDPVKLQRLRGEGLAMHFWKIPSKQLPTLYNSALLPEASTLISQDLECSYFVSAPSHPFSLPPDALEVHLCPSPVSTLVMLQTRARDEQRRLSLLLGDYALAHYGELHAALRTRLPHDAPLPSLSPLHKGFTYYIRKFFRK